MRARAWSAVVAIASLTATAAAEPKPKPVDASAFRDQLLVLQDGDGGVYVVLPRQKDKDQDARLWYGAPQAKNLYEQVLTGASSDGSTGAWDLATWSPRVAELRPGSVGRRGDGSFYRFCGPDKQIDLTPVPADKAKAILGKSTLMTTAMIRRPYLLARDDSGVYYYVDVIRDAYGGNGYRVFVGKKGGMKQKPLSDVARDEAGDVFATKTGDIRIVKDTVDGRKATVTWIKGSKRIALSQLDVDVSSPLIYKDLGVYSFTGNICESF